MGHTARYVRHIKLLLAGNRSSTQDNATGEAWTFLTDVVCSPEFLCNKSSASRRFLCSFDCSPCFCDDDCQLYGDCCPDFFSSADYSAMETDIFSHLSCSSSNWASWEDKPSVFMLKRCPDSSVQNSIEVVRNCEHPDMELKEHATLVSHKRYQITFLNRFCALCHGVGPTDFYPWTHHVKCASLAEIANEADADELWRAVVRAPSCTIHSLPPEGIDPRRCWEVEVDTCNPNTSLSTNAEGAIERLCRDLWHPVKYYGTTPFYTTHRNTFCAICNGVSLDPPVSCDRQKPIVPPFPLSVLIDFNRKSRMPRVPSPDVESCKPLNIWDPFERKCRPLQCPDRTVLTDGECLSVYTATRGLGFRFQLQAYSTSGYTMSEPNLFFLKSIIKLRREFEPYKPFVLTTLEMKLYAEQSFTPPIENRTMFSVYGEFVSLSNKTLQDMTTTMEHLKRLSWQFDEENVTLFASTDFCGNDSFSPDGSFRVKPSSEILSNVGSFTCSSNTTGRPTPFDGDSTGQHKENLENIMTNTVSEVSKNPEEACQGSTKCDGRPTGATGFPDPLNSPSPTILLAEIRLELPLVLLHPYCADQHKCYSAIVFKPVDFSPVCPHIEVNTTSHQLRFDDKLSKLWIGQIVVEVNASDVLDCEHTLAICQDAVRQISREICQPSCSKVSGIWQSMGILSSICISLSLAGLFATFTIYCLLPELRTAPGKITMALVLNLFLAQLVFLVGANRTSNVRVCQIVGIFLHYIWLSTFAWTSIAAYHMYTVFTKLLTAPGNKTFLIGVLVANLSPVFITTACTVYNLIRSGGQDPAYGGNVCFLSNPINVSIFFVGPLAAVLLVNFVCFVRTVMAIRNVPDMKPASNQSNKRHVIKMSALLGFSWVAGLLAAILDSTELWYVFFVLTGGQGTQIFLAYCVNCRIWRSLSAKYRP